jgi:hypothetical protein
MFQNLENHWFTRAFSVTLGVIFAASAFKKDLFLRYGRSGPWTTHTVTRVGRVCFFLMGRLLVFYGLTGITEYWYFAK